MVKAIVNIFEYEDNLVAETKDKFGFKNKNEALNFIIRKFEPHLKEADNEKAKELLNDLDTITQMQKEEPAETFNTEKVQVFEPAKKSKKKKNKIKKTKKLKDEKKKQSIKLLKNILSER